ncbi:pyridoxal phosphate-dependent decarboxylase family protein [Thiocapsa marina]|uniref:Aromatic-L-amino-acid decarboxylase n=1 Tax=Thiocapsa marina 5811 TaxID=768671 RepID=F9UIK6_9GAMM|nr:pyridoxal-dependent decarboxylase [Thiocapsa marina]EGV15960.1 Aromatic-L-amino-acid decarboxylase [Thiocapsa marina 5811]
MQKQNIKQSALDPDDWDEYRVQAHRLLDVCVDHLQNARERPWRPVPDGIKQRLGLDDASSPSALSEVADELLADILPFGTGNTHPRFFGWVHGTGLSIGVLADLVASTMNSNCGGRDHVAVYVERAVIDWCKRTFGFPDEANGVLVTGTSQATVIALAVARTRALGAGSRREGLRNGPALAAYAREGVHIAIIKALELLGIGADALRRIPLDDAGAMDMACLHEAVECDREAGRVPFCLIGTAGSVDRGEFDDLQALAGFARERELWFHIDGAFGAWVVLADAPWNRLAAGIGQADSVAFDFHKWMYVQYDCGAVLIRDEALHRQTFAGRPAYLADQVWGLGGGEPWFFDYGIDLSRGFRALRVWAALRLHGSAAFGATISRNCALALRMAECVSTAPELELAAPVRLNVCCFRAAPQGLAADAQDQLNVRIAQELQIAGSAVFSTTMVDGRIVLRAAITNHRTDQQDVDESVAAAAQLAQRLIALFLGEGE